MKRKLLSVLLILCMLTGLLPISALAAEPSFGDTAGHWAAEAIDTWADREVLKGSGGLFRPNDPITRAELAAVLNRVIGYTATGGSFADVPEGAWYYDDVAKLYNAGIMLGSGNGIMQPEKSITREEAVTLIARAFGITGAANIVNPFPDAGTISGWAAASVNGMKAEGYISGYQGGGFMPKASITRAEVVTILNNMVTLFFSTAGESDCSQVGEIDSNALINTAGVTVLNMTLNGSLWITEGVGLGDVTLKNVSVSGTTYIRGGGENSIHISGGSFGSIILDSHTNPHLNLSSDTKVEHLYFDGSASVTQGGVSIIYNADTDTVTFGGTIDKVALNKDGTVTVTVGGIVCDIVPPEGGISNIELDPTAVIKEQTLDSAVTVGGTGKVEKTAVNSDGVVIEGTVGIDVEDITVADDVVVSVDDKEYTGDGGTLPPPTGGGGGGGGTVPPPEEKDPTAKLVFKWKADGTAGGQQSEASNAGAVSIGPINSGVERVIIELTNTSAQSLALSGTNAGDVTLSDENGTASRWVTVDTASVPSSGGSKSFTLTVSESGKSSIVYNITVTVAAVPPGPTAKLVFKWKADGTAGGLQSTASDAGALAIGPVDNAAASVIIGLTNTSAQSLALSGTDSSDVSISGANGSASRSLTVNTSSVAASGGSKSFTLTVSESGKDDLAYNITVTVAQPPASESTAKLVFTWLADGTAGGLQSTASDAGALAIGPINNEVQSVIIGLSNTAAQSLALSGTDSADVSISGESGSASRSLTVDTSYVAASGGSKSFTLTVSESEKDSIAYNITVTVSGASVQHTVTYNLNGATGTAPGSQTAPEGSDINLAGTSGITVPTGKSFRGWCTAANANGNYYNAGQTIELNNSLNLYAIWTGDGSNETNPIEIYTSEHFDAIRNALGLHYKLAAEISVSNWAPIGSNTSPFTGTLDGNGNRITINSLSISGLQYVGLFGYIKAGKIANLAVAGSLATTVSTAYIGAIAGYSHGATIKQCVSTANVSSVSGTAKLSIGGIVGTNTGTVDRCYSTGTVSAYTAVTGRAGGIAGNSTGFIRWCYATGAVLATGSSANSTAGGIAGLSTGQITECVALNLSVTATGATTNIGRIAGEETSGISNCYGLYTMLGGTWSNRLSGKDGEDVYKGLATLKIFYQERDFWNFTLENETQWKWGADIVSGYKLPVLWWQAADDIPSSLPEHLK